MKVLDAHMPPNAAEIRKLYYLVIAQDIFGCRKAPDADTMNNTLGEETEEIYSQL